MLIILIMLVVNLCVLGDSDEKRHVENSAIPINNEPMDYNIETWINQLNLQHCVLVELGDGFFALFVEFHHANGKIDEYFAGICNLEVLLKWKYCSSILEEQRPEKCTLKAADMYKIRVHRRLCDFSILAPFAQQCNCSVPLFGQALRKVTGFPTCFVSPLPDSLCSSNNVCGFASCSAETVAYHIVKFECSQTCIGHDKFCQYPITNTTLAAEIASFWSDWAEPSCVDLPCKTVIAEARCINKITCPAELEDCKCHSYLDKATMKVVRTYTSSAHYWQRVEFENEWDDLDYLRKTNLLDYNRDAYYPSNRRKRIELSFDPYFATIYALKNKNKSKRGKLRERDAKDYDFDDDDEPEEDEDNNEEDIVIEEDNEVYVTTMKSVEMGDIAQMQADCMRNNTLNEALSNEVKEELKMENLTAKENCSNNLRVFTSFMVMVVLHSYVLTMESY